MRTTPQQNEDDASNASGETKPHTKKKKKRARSKHWQTECRRQRVKENNRTQRLLHNATGQKTQYADKTDI